MLGNCVRPFTYGTTLDDTLDSGKINVKCATYGKVIKPFTLLSIAIYEDNVLQDTVYCLVANAEREMVRRDTYYYLQCHGALQWRIKIAPLHSARGLFLCPDLWHKNWRKIMQTGANWHKLAQIFCTEKGENPTKQ